MLDQPASGQALWAIYDSTGIRPEWLLPSLHFESGLSTNPPGNGLYFGINEMSGDTLRAWGIDPAEYVTWPASEQLSRVVKPWFESLVRQYGPLRSATRVEQGNFLPATLKTATSLSSVVTAAPSRFYEDNLVFDPARKGSITVQDLASAMAKSASSPAVERAIADTYALRPGETPTDPVYGKDFARMGTGKAILLGIGILGVSAAAAWALSAPAAPARRRRRPLLAARENPAGRRPPMHVQSLLFRRDMGWTEGRAKRWARSHGYRSGDVDVTPEYIHLRQMSPAGMRVIRTTPFGRGIEARVGR